MCEHLKLKKDEEKKSYDHLLSLVKGKYQF